MQNIVQNSSQSNSQGDISESAVLQKLKQGPRGYYLSKEGEGWHSQCPIRPGNPHSLVIEFKEGKTLLTCRSHKCSQADIEKKLGLSKEQPQAIESTGASLVTLPHQAEHSRSSGEASSHEKVSNVSNVSTSQKLETLPPIETSEPRGEVVTGGLPVLVVLDFIKNLQKLPRCLRVEPQEKGGWLVECPLCASIRPGPPLVAVNQIGQELVARCYGCSDEPALVGGLIFAGGKVPLLGLHQWQERELSRGHKKTALLELLSERLPLPAEFQKPKQPKRRLSFSELVNKPYPQRKMMFGPFLKEAGLGEVYAKRGQGKTWFVASLAYAIATGGEFLDWSATGARGVLIVDGENDPDEFKNRLLDVHRLSGEPEFPQKLHFMMKQDLENGWDQDLSTEEGRALVEAELEGVELLILDNLSCLCGKLEENEATSWEPINTWLLSLKKRGIAVLFVHHAGKGGQQRGHSKKEDNLDYVICLQEPENRKQNGAAFKVAFEKNRVGPMPAPFEAELISEGEEDQERPVGWEKRPVGKLGLAPLSKLQQEIAKRLSEGQSAAQIVDGLNTTRGTVSKVKKKLSSVNPAQPPTPSAGDVSNVSTPKGVWKHGNTPSAVMGQASKETIGNIGNTGNILSTNGVSKETTRKPPAPSPVIRLDLNQTKPIEPKRGAPPGATLKTPMKTEASPGTQLPRVGFVDEFSSDEPVPF